MLIRHDFMPASIFSGAEPNRPNEMLDARLIAHDPKGIESDPKRRKRYKRTRLEGMEPQALEREEQARGRVELLLRGALSVGRIRAFAYHPDGRAWGEVPDWDVWSKRNFGFPGLETFIDPDTSSGPDVMGSPVFVEERAFEKWLAEENDKRPKLDVRTGRRGRPSVARTLVLDEFKRRRAEGRTMAGVTDEARELRAWFERTHTGADAPAVKTIRDAISPFFKV